MTTDLLVCCERLDESKYWHKCACPTAVVECESEQINPVLCGYSEYSGFESVPPRKYLTQTSTYFGALSSYNNEFAFCPGVINRKVTYSGSCVNSYDPSDECSLSEISDNSSLKTNTYSYDSECELAFVGDYDSALNCIQLSQVSTSSTSKIYTYTGAGITTGSNNIQSDLTVEDTDTDAIARETPTAGTSCSSLWETRTTGFSFTSRTVEYTIECADLVIGLEYEVTLTIRRRTATTDATGAWEDVAVTPETFTATAKTETIDDGGNPIELDHVQGYEYTITGVNIERTA